MKNFLANTALPKLDLELLHPGTNRRRFGIAMLVIGVTLALAVIAHTLQARNAVTALLADAEVPTDTHNPNDKPANAEEIKAVQSGIERLALPWGTLFAALEGIAVEDVHLVSVEPEADKSTVKIVAEAADVYGMLEYVRVLATKPGLRDVLLEQYEVHTVDPDQPVRFILTAVWRAAS